MYADCTARMPEDNATTFKRKLESEVQGVTSKASQRWYRKMESLLLEHDDGVLRVIRSVEYYLNA